MTEDINQPYATQPEHLWPKLARQGP